MENFTLNIQMGNEGMQDGTDVAFALGMVADLIRTGRTDGLVRDVNGNTVGSWRLS